MRLDKTLSAGFSLLYNEGPKSVVGAVMSSLATRAGLFRGESVMAADWDCLVVLDACRPDALAEVVPEYEFLPDGVEARYSVASASDTWMKRTFSDSFDETLRETVYVTANPNSKKHTPTERFMRVNEVWSTDFDPGLGTISPRPVTKHAVSLHRELNPERLLVHYMQPHFPSIPESLGFGIRKGAPNPDKQTWVWSDGRPEQFSREELWTAYIENLRYVLDDIELLLCNIDAPQLIITSDHGNAFGEWNLWGHPHQALPVLRKVPWVNASATDEHTLIPDIEPQSDGLQSVEEQLGALGYKG